MRILLEVKSLLILFLSESKKRLVSRFHNLEDRNGYDLKQEMEINEMMERMSGF